MNLMAIVSRPKLHGFGDHWGVLMPNGLVAHNTAEKNVQVVTYEEFAAGRAVQVIKEIHKSQWVPTNWRLHQELTNPRKYDLVNNNCEIFANRISGYPEESPQIRGMLFLSIAMLALTAIK